MKKVFVLIGSHDGNIGVFTNVKNAYQSAVTYITNCDNEVATTYQQALKGCKGWGCTIESKSYNTQATIEVHYLNLKIN